MNLLILGAGGHGKGCKEIAEATCAFEKIDFLDDRFSESSSVAVGRLDDCEGFVGDYEAAFVGIGNNNTRSEWIKKLKNLGFKLVNLVHPRAYVSPSATVGEGNVVEPMAVIKAGAKIGSGCIISAGAVIDHDCTVSDGAHIAPGVIVKNTSVVPENTKLESGTVFMGERD